MQGKEKQDLYPSRGTCTPDSEQNPPLQGKSKQDLYVSYGKCKQDYKNPTLKSGSYEHNPSLQGKSKQDLYVSYGKCKPDYESPTPESGSFENTCNGQKGDSDHKGKSTKRNEARWEIHAMTKGGNPRNNLGFACGPSKAVACRNESSPLREDFRNSYLPFSLILS